MSNSIYIKSKDLTNIIYMNRASSTLALKDKVSISILPKLTHPSSLQFKIPAAICITSLFLHCSSRPGVPRIYFFLSFFFQRPAINTSLKKKKFSRSFYSFSVVPSGLHPRTMLFPKSWTSALPFHDRFNIAGQMTDSQEKDIAINLKSKRWVRTATPKLDTRKRGAGGGRSGSM